MKNIVAKAKPAVEAKGKAEPATVAAKAVAKPASKTSASKAPAPKASALKSVASAAKAPAKPAPAPAKAAVKAPSKPVAKASSAAAKVPLANTPKPKASSAPAAVAAAKAAAPKAVAPAQKPAAPVARPLAPIAVAPKPVVSAPMAEAPRPAAAIPAAAAQPAKKPVAPATGVRHGFKPNEFVVYPSHGVGRIVAVEEQSIAGMKVELFVIAFEHAKMTMRVPTAKLAENGMRKLADESVVKKAMETLKGRARIKRTMWSRRAQEYDAKIKSGDLVQIAEVVRDLYRAESQPEQSYSERQLFEAALDRMAREIAAIEKLDERGAVQKIHDVLSKSAKSRKAAEAGAAAAEPEAEADAAEPQEHAA